VHHRELTDFDQIFSDCVGSVVRIGMHLTHGFFEARYELNTSQN